MEASDKVSTKIHEMKLRVAACVVPDRNKEKADDIRVYDGSGSWDSAEEIVKSIIQVVFPYFALLNLEELEA